MRCEGVDRREVGARQRVATQQSLGRLPGILGVSLSWLLVGHGDEPTSSDDLDEIKVVLSRVQAQLADTLNEVDVLAARIDIARGTR